MSWHDGRQNRCDCLLYGYRSRRARYFSKRVKSSLSGDRDRRCFFESIAITIVTMTVFKRAMVIKEVDLAGAGHVVVRRMGRRNKRYAAPRDKRWMNGSDTGDNGGSSGSSSPCFSRRKS